MSEERRGGRITEEILFAEGEEREKGTEMMTSQRRNDLPGVIREVAVMRRVTLGQVTVRIGTRKTIAARPGGTVVRIGWFSVPELCLTP